VSTYLGGSRSQRPMRLFRLFGIDFTVSWTWMFMAVLLTYVAGTSFRPLLPRLPLSLVWGLAVVAALLSAVSLYGHELAHALVARRFGIPVRTINLFLLGGMAHIGADSPSPAAELLVAVAGPITSLAIGLAGAGAAWGAWRAAPAVGALGLWLATMNLPLAVFNLLPAYPLDGGRVLRSALWYAGQDARWGSTVAARVGQVVAAALLLVGLYLLFTDPASSVSGLWLMLVAWFMYAGAASAQHAAVFSDILSRLSVAAVMEQRPTRVDADVSLQTFADDYLALARRPGGRAVVGPHLVCRDDLPLGLVGVRELRRYPAPAWPRTTVERAMVKLETAPSLDPGAPAARALQLLLDDGCDLVTVIVEGRLLGLVSRNDLARAVERARGRAIEAKSDRQ